MKTIERALAPSPGLDAEALIEEARWRQRRRRWVIAVAVAAVFASLLGLMASAGGGTPVRSLVQGGKRAPGAGAVPKLGVRWRTKVPAGVVSMAAAYGSLWVTGRSAVTRMDATSGKVTARIATPLTRELSDVASLDGRIWVSSGGLGDKAGVLYGIDPATNRVSRTVSVPGQPYAMTAGDGYLWVDVYENGPELRPFNPRTGTFLPPVVATMEQLGRPAYGLGAVWVTSAEPLGRVWKIDPKTMRASSATF